jgi:ribonuclease P protein component
VIWRVRERAVLDRIERSGRRVHGGPLWCRFVLEPVGSPPCVAFAIGRRHGTAVERNRLRRRLREAIRLAQPPLPAGAYLVGGRPEAIRLSASELRAAVATLVTAVDACTP